CAPALRGRPRQARALSSRDADGIPSSVVRCVCRRGSCDPWESSLLLALYFILRAKFAKPISSVLARSSRCRIGKLVEQGNILNSFARWLALWARRKAICHPTLNPTCTLGTRSYQLQ